MCSPRKSFVVQKIISGGQTGADRAALDIAIELGIPHGGYVPQGRRAEDGPLHHRYCVTELAVSSYDTRTEANVRVADATLIVAIGPLTSGSALTRRLADKHGKPVLHIDLATVGREQAAATVLKWLAEQHPAVLNVAGPRESTTPDIYRKVCELLRTVFADMGTD